MFKLTKRPENSMNTVKKRENSPFCDPPNDPKLWPKWKKSYNNFSQRPRGKKSKFHNFAKWTPIYTGVVPKVRFWSPFQLYMFPWRTGPWRRGKLSSVTKGKSSQFFKIKYSFKQLFRTKNGRKFACQIGQIYTCHYFLPFLSAYGEKIAWRRGNEKNPAPYLWDKYAKIVQN